MGIKHSRRFEYIYEIWEGDTKVFEGTSYQIAAKYNVNYRTIYNEYYLDSIFLGKYKITRRDNDEN